MEQPLREGHITLPDGRTIAYAEWGDAHGDPVFYFHGWPGSRLEAALCGDAARRHHVRLISLDRPGYGRSTSQRNRTIGAWARDVTAVADALTRKLQLAVKKHRAKSVVLCGGVAANSRLRALAKERVEEEGARLYLPSIALCTDNGAMIAVAGYEALKRGAASELPLDADPNWRI